MRELLQRLAALVVAAIGLAAAIEPSVSSAVLLAAAAVLIIAALVRVDAPDGARHALDHARGEIDPSAPVAQSDPDAAGHTRSRAPGFVTAA